MCSGDFDETDFIWFKGEPPSFSLFLLNEREQKATGTDQKMRTAGRIAKGNREILICEPEMSRLRARHASAGSSGDDTAAVAVQRCGELCAFGLQVIHCTMLEFTDANII